MIYLLIFTTTSQMNLFNNIKHFQFYIWLGAVWLFVWLFFSLLNHPEQFSQHALNEIWRAVYIVFANFIFFEYGLPLIVKKRSTLLFNVLLAILLLPLQFILVSFGLYGWISLGMDLNIYTQFRFVNLIPNEPFNLMLNAAFYEARTGVASIFFFGMAKLFYQNFKLKQDAQQLRIEKQEAELNYLKSQTNPHFLFNTLNNIYSLARDKSDKTPESVLRLSKILRFMLYDTQGEYTTIEQELELISNYIALEKLRYDDSMELSFRHEIEDMKQPLPPLLMIPLIENAFKHGVSETSDHSFVDIDLSTSNQQLTLVVKNSTEKPHGEDGVKENIGLSNLRRQLELLYTDYHLSAEQGDSVFTAILKVNLASHV